MASTRFVPGNLWHTIHNLDSELDTTSGHLSTSPLPALLSWTLAAGVQTWQAYR